MSGNLTLAQAGINALLGYGVVFVGLSLLMGAVLIMGKIMTAGKKAPAPQTAPAVTPAPSAPPSVAAPVAPGSAGQVKLYDVPDREAAMIMAIVADQMGKPLNQLRFLSIKEVK